MLKKAKAMVELKADAAKGPFPAVGEPAVYTIPQFLKAHDVSYGKFYQMCRAGIGPRMMKYGTRKVISVEEAARWREERAKAAK